VEEETQDLDQVRDLVYALDALFGLAAGTGLLWVLEQKQLLPVRDLPAGADHLQTPGGLGSDLSLAYPAQWVAGPFRWDSSGVDLSVVE
jgi:hypothetical protein